MENNFSSDNAISIKCSVTFEGRPYRVSPFLRCKKKTTLDYTHGAMKRSLLVPLSVVLPVHASVSITTGADSPATLRLPRLKRELTQRAMRDTVRGIHTLGQDVYYRCYDRAISLLPSVRVLFPFPSSVSLLEFRESRQFRSQYNEKFGTQVPFPCTAKVASNNYRKIRCSRDERN